MDQRLPQGSQNCSLSASLIPQMAQHKTLHLPSPWFWPRGKGIGQAGAQASDLGQIFPSQLTSSEDLMLNMTAGHKDARMSTCGA